MTVPFTVGGTATDGADYTITASPIVIPAGATTGTITITLVDDATDEANETVILTLGTPTNAVLGAAAVDTATITDNDPPVAADDLYAADRGHAAGGRGAGRAAQRLGHRHRPGVHGRPGLRAGRTGR